jgi:hypothetical protein
MEWTDADYERMSWHDNHVHGLQIEADDDGTGRLILDLDYIVEWLCPVDGAYSFRVAPATLTFNRVFGLKIELDWATVQAGMTPFSISQISREKREHPSGYEDWLWSIGVNWPEGFISFIGTGFHQRLRSEPIITQAQHLEPGQRKSLPFTST